MREEASGKASLGPCGLQCKPLIVVLVRTGFVRGEEVLTAECHSAL
jgi:hypothetical protein